MAYLRHLFEIATLRTREYWKAEGANKKKAS
jgi:hypothetical protein